MADLEQRVTALEQDRAQIRAEWATVQQAPLVNARLLNALRETQLEHSRMLAEHDRRFDAIDRRFDDVDARHVGLLAGQELIVSMLDTLIEREPGD